MRNKSKAIIIIAVLTISVMLSSCSYARRFDQLENYTPVAVAATPTASPSPTPTIEIAEDINKANFTITGFHVLLNYMTTSQYNYVMTSVEDYFNSLYQSTYRNYNFTQYKQINSDMLTGRFSFADDAEMAVPLDRFNVAFVDIHQEYMLIFNNESLSSNDTNYIFTINLYINKEQSTTFDFEVNKKTLQIKVK